MCLHAACNQSLVFRLHGRLAASLIILCVHLGRTERPQHLHEAHALCVLHALGHDLEGQRQVVLHVLLQALHHLLKAADKVSFGSCHRFALKASSVPSFICSFLVKAILVNSCTGRLLKQYVSRSVGLHESPGVAETSFDWLGVIPKRLQLEEVLFILCFNNCGGVCDLKQAII